MAWFMVTALGPGPELHAPSSDTQSSHRNTNVLLDMRPYRLGRRAHDALPLRVTARGSAPESSEGLGLGLLSRRSALGLSYTLQAQTPGRRIETQMFS